MVPKVMVPMQISDTVRPVLPSRRCFIDQALALERNDTLSRKIRTKRGLGAIVLS